MGDDGYRVVFDASDHWPQLWFALPGVLFIVIARALWRTRASSNWWRWPADTRPWLRSLQAGGMLAFAVLWTGGVVVGAYLLASGTANVVEGVVTNFQPGAKRERFEVGGVKFDSSPYEITSAYNAFGGPFGNGSQVRIHYTQGGAHAAILKFELYEGAVCR